MQNHRQPDEQILQNRSLVVLKNLFNMISRMNTYFRGSNNSQFFFSGDMNTTLFGYQKFSLNGQLKLLKKYMLPGEGSIIFLDKSNNFFLIQPLKLELWKFDYFLNIDVHQKIHEEEHCFDFEQWLDNFGMSDIGINQDENILVFYMFKKIFFYHKNQLGFWKLEQTIDSTNYYQMYHIRFNQSNDIIVAYQVKGCYSSKHHLIIFNKNQDGIWQTTHHVQESLSPFYFIDDQQFLLFKYNKYVKRLQEISILDHKAEEKTQFSCGYQCLFGNYCDPPLIEIKSKNLVLLNGTYIFSIQQQKLFWQLSGLKIQNISQVGYARNSEFLFLKLFNNYEQRKFQVYRIYDQ